MDTETRNNVAETTERLVKAGQIGKIQTLEKHPFMLFERGGYEVHDLEKYLDAPLRINKNITFLSIESFNRYVNVHKQKGTRIHLRRTGNAEAILDGAEPTFPSWETHIANFTLTYSERWMLWDSRNKKEFSQKDFAEFIEDNTRDFFAPTGGQMLDSARSLEGEVTSKFTSAYKDPSTGDVKFAFDRTTTARAGQKGDLELPSKFTLNLPVLEGEEPRQVELRLRWNIEDGHPKFSYEILKRTELLEGVRRSIFAMIKNETAIEPYLT